MKKILLSFLFMIVLASSAMAIGTRIKVVNLTLTTSGTEYSLVIPNGASTLTVQSRTSADFKMASTALASGTTYFTVKSGAAYYETNVNSYNGVTLYFQSANNGQIIEATYWQ